jgi:hypothetical protein
MHTADDFGGSRLFHSSLLVLRCHWAKGVFPRDL